MSMLSPLLKDLVVDGIILARMRRHAEARMSVMALYLLAGLLASAGVVFLVYAAFLALEDFYSPLRSALWTGGIMDMPGQARFQGRVLKAGHAVGGYFRVGRTAWIRGWLRGRATTYGNGHLCIPRQHGRGEKGG